MNNQIVFGRPSIGEDEIEAVVAVLKSGWIGMGPRCIEFEKEFAEYVGAPYAVAVSSCTAALHIALLASGIGKGDEVITTPFTFAATLNAIIHCGARPVLVDIAPQTLNIAPNRIEAAITKRTKAIIPVHFGGLSCDMDSILIIAERHNLAVIEDAAHAVGTRYGSTMVGGFPNSLACFSFYPNKNITSIEGGMITTSSEKLARTMSMMRLHGLDNEAWKRYLGGTKLMPSEAVMNGFKYNMTDVQAAIGIIQLRKLEGFMKVREEYARIYDDAFSDLPCSRQPRPSGTVGRHALHLYLLVLPWEISRDTVIQEIRDAGIGATVHYRPAHLHPYFKERLGYGEGSFPVTERIGKSIFTIPLSPSMTVLDVTQVAETTRQSVLNHLVT